MIIFTLIMPILFLESNKDFFKQVEKERNEGYTWHYVGEQEADPTAKSIRVNDKYIFWKLK